MFKSISVLSISTVVFVVSVNIGIGFGADYDLQSGDVSIMTTLYTPKSQTVIEPALLTYPPDEQVKIWVFFTDKGIFSADKFESALKSTRSALTDRTLKRRLKSRGENVVDFRDIPVFKSYIDQVISRGVTLKHRSKWFNGVSVVARATDIDQIAELDFVRRIEKVKTLGKELDKIKLEESSMPKPGEIYEYSYDYGPSESQLKQINVPPAHEMGFDGYDVIVCMLDVGYKKGHEAFAQIINDGRLLAEWDFINNDGETDLEAGDPPTQADHGTLTWSALGGQTDGHLYGPAFNSTFILGKTEDVSMEQHIEEDYWAAAAEWADSIGADVISASLGYRWFDPGQGDYEYEDLDGNTTIVTIAADLAVYNGIAVCTAQGNNGSLGPGSLLAPADGDSVTACGAVHATGEIAGFSALGPTFDGRIKPEIVARGVSTDCADPGDLNGYRTASGTSLSTPLIGGASAVILSAHPNWTPMQVREALMMTADNFDNPDNSYGWGLINTTNAIFYHPEGDIVFDFTPLSYALPGEEMQISGDITCSEGLNSSSVILFWKEGGSGNYSFLQMNHSGDTYSAAIPAHTEGDTIYYGVYAEKTNGSSEVYPIGAPRNNFVTPVTYPVFVDGFEYGPYKWETGGDYADWGLTATYSNSGNMAFNDSPQGNYKNNADNWVVMRQQLDFSSAQNPQLLLYHRYQLQSDFDYVYIEGSSDGGSSWLQIGEPITGQQATFIHSAYSLADFGGCSEFLMRFRLSTDGSVTRDGWFVDDIVINWEATAVDDGDETIIPGVFSLDANYPNPFNSSTEIDYRIPINSEVDLSIYNILGQRVKNLVKANQKAGFYRVRWDGCDESGREVSSGIYFYRLTTDDFDAARRMMLLK